MSPAFVPGALSKAFAVRVGADCSVRVAVVSEPGRCGYWTRHRKLPAITVIDLDPDADPPKVLAIGADSAGNFLEVIWLELDNTVEVVIHAMDDA